MVDNFKLIKPLLKFTDPQDFYFLQILLRKKDGNEVPAGSDNQRRLLRDYHITSPEMLDEIKEDVVCRCNETNARAYLRLNKRNYKTIAMAYAQETLEKARKGEQFGNTYNEINSVIGRYPEGHKGDKTWLVDIDDHGPGSERVAIVRDIIRRCEPFDCGQPSENVLYHATPAANLASVLEHGLLREHDAHKSAFVSLSRKPDSWLQKGMVLLEVNIDKLECPVRSWESELDELCVWGDIPPERVKPCTNGKVVAVIPTNSGTHLIARPFNVQKFNSLLKDEGLSNDGEIAILKDNPTLLYHPQKDCAV